MKTRRVLIADDEVLTRNRIRALVERYPHYKVVAEAETGTATLESIKIHRPDVILLDISMPKLNGMEVMAQVDRSHYKILVFITAHEEFTLQAFENAALDYLLKPFDQTRFAKLMDRIEKQFNLLQPSTPMVIVVKSGGSSYRIPVNTILYIRADDNYVELHTRDRLYRKRGSITSILDQLNSKFIRVHRSTILNKDEIRTLKHLTQGDYLIQMSDGKKLTSSKSYRRQVRALLA